jgi:hypothetical protein
MTQIAGFEMIGGVVFNALQYFSVPHDDGWQCIAEPLFLLYFHRITGNVMSIATFSLCIFVIFCNMCKKMKLMGTFHEW